MASAKAFWPEAFGDGGGGNEYETVDKEALSDLDPCTQ